MMKRSASEQIDKKNETRLYFTIVQNIFSFPLGSSSYFDIFENGVLLMYTLEGISSVASIITAYEKPQ